MPGKPLFSCPGQIGVQQPATGGEILSYRAIVGSPDHVRQRFDKCLSGSQRQLICWLLPNRLNAGKMQILTFFMHVNPQFRPENAFFLHLHPDLWRLLCKKNVNPA
ncbi:MAG: hypothetical protein OXC81_01650 [Betaproteobacteria bacterium]|nr:hypothetical protein [Betaproteobacteria bacterium]